MLPNIYNMYSIYCDAHDRVLLIAVLFFREWKTAKTKSPTREKKLKGGCLTPNLFIYHNNKYEMIPFGIKKFLIDFQIKHSGYEHTDMGPCSVVWVAVDWFRRKHVSTHQLAKSTTHKQSLDGMYTEFSSFDFCS